MPKSTKKSTEETSVHKAPEGATLIRAGKGALIVGPGVSPNAMGFRQVADGVCHKCETAAPPWEPPVEDFRYANRIQTLKEVHGFTTDKAAHEQYMKDTGGFIEICKKCGTAFFVPASAAKIATKE